MVVQEEEVVVVELPAPSPLNSVFTLPVPAVSQTSENLERSSDTENEESSDEDHGIWEKYEQYYVQRN